MTCKKRRRSPKVDLKNVDATEAANMISSYQQHKREEVPLRINEQLTILVTADKCNEKYRQWYINTKL